MPPSFNGAFTYFGKYERKVYKDQLLQNVANAIAKNGIFLSNFKKGIEGAVSVDGASFLININSFFERYLLFSGNAVTADMDPHAMCYGGHQFGNWAGQLGDGRAINLGQVTGIDSNSYMLQLKGAGPTPYSRSGDGRAVLRSSIREYLCSEAMHHLGVPTTRALSLCSTGDNVVRDMFYDGNLSEEIGAVL